MAIRRKKKRVAVLIRSPRRQSALGTRTARAASHSVSAHPAAGPQSQPSPASSGSKGHSIDWEEEHITTDLLDDALAGTAAALDANRRYRRGALPGRGSLRCPTDTGTERFAADRLR